MKSEEGLIAKGRIERNDEKKKKQAKAKAKIKKPEMFLTSQRGTFQDGLL